MNLTSLRQHHLQYRGTVLGQTKIKPGANLIVFLDGFKAVHFLLHLIHDGIDGCLGILLWQYSKMMLLDLNQVYY